MTVTVGVADTLAARAWRVGVFADDIVRRDRWTGAVDPAIDYSREARTTVTFLVEPTTAGTRVTVSETGFDQIPLSRRAKVYADNAQGWATVVVWLKEHVEAAAATH